ncbi:sulfatase [Bacteroidales bacterium OttesenSCG-928-B11]|nr:sulfatase [Bacteroidales bacterium OttesenSCG-928-C03]MDL2312382.1 sulfatase [Bacteroidales bacterium OttesenSCG-928-B11]MDL2326638.1 sulfatase [Bacteroidales bacterium OttesenSCG-928-A14]
MRKKTSLLFLAVWLLVTLPGCDKRAKEKVKQDTENLRPNIIIIMTDDHAYQAISAYDTTLIRTPNIDRLAEEGMRFANSFVSNSVSSPSRAVCLTGKHSHRNGHIDNTCVFDSTQQTFPKIMQSSGYQTALIGKWHLVSTPTGFDHWEILPGQGEYYHPEFITENGKHREQGYVTDIITDKAIHWIAEQRDQNKPFVLLCNHKAPHREWSPSPADYPIVLSKTYPEPETLFDDYSGRGTAAKTAEMRIKDHMGLTMDSKLPPGLVDSLGYNEFLSWYHTDYTHIRRNLSEEELAAIDDTYRPMIEDFRRNPRTGEELTRWKYQRYMQDYLTTIKSVDDNIGRLYNHLKENNLLENTLIVYVSDQGFYLGEHGWFDKRFMYEESFRTPLIMRYPKIIKANSVNYDLVQNIDYAETFLDLAGITIPDDMQGRSLLPLLRGEKVEWRDALYYHYYEYPSIHAVKRHYGVRTDRYKLIHFYYDIDEWELYDLQNDPKEMNNVIDAPQYQEIKKMLMKRLAELREEYGDHG